MIQITTKQKEGYISKFQIEHFINEYTTRASVFLKKVNAARGAPPGTLACVVDIMILFFDRYPPTFTSRRVRITLFNITYLFVSLK